MIQFLTHPHPPILFSQCCFHQPPDLLYTILSHTVKPGNVRLEREVNDNGGSVKVEAFDAVAEIQ